jgi:hypothetical protein
MLPIRSSTWSIVEGMTRFLLLCDVWVSVFKLGDGAAPQRGRRGFHDFCFSRSSTSAIVAGRRSVASIAPRKWVSGAMIVLSTCDSSTS